MTMDSRGRMLEQAHWSLPFQYTCVDIVNNTKILEYQGIRKHHNKLSDISNTKGTAYISIDKNGIFHRLRIYDYSRHRLVSIMVFINNLVIIQHYIYIFGKAQNSMVILIQQGFLTKKILKNTINIWRELLKMNGLIDKDELKSSMDNLRYREVVISYKGYRYHIEAYDKKYVIGIFEQKEYRIKKWIEVVGNSNDDAFQKLMNESLFMGNALKDILDKIEWIEG